MRRGESSASSSKRDGLKQGAYLWQQTFKSFILGEEMGFSEMTGDSNIYRKVFCLNGREEELVLGQYVDDSIILASSPEAQRWLMERLGKRFPVNPNSSGNISFSEPGLILSMNVRYDIDKGVLQFDQSHAIEHLAKRLGLTESAPRTLPIPHDFNLPKLKVAEVDVNQYLSVLGSILHIAQVSRPDVSFACGALSRHSAAPGVAHYEAALDLVKYLYSTRKMYIQYQRCEARGNDPVMYEKGFKADSAEPLTIEQRLVASVPSNDTSSPTAYVDADYAGERDTRRSTSGFIVMMNSGPIVWSSKLQKLCAQSSAESEIYAVCDAAKEAIHIRLLCEEMGIRPPGVPLRIFEDNSACVQMGHSIRGSNAAKHFEVRLRFLHERIQLKEIEFAKIATSDQLADPFTKPLPYPAFSRFRDIMLRHD